MHVYANGNDPIERQMAIRNDGMNGESPLGTPVDWLPLMGCRHN